MQQNSHNEIEKEEPQQPISEERPATSTPRKVKKTRKISLAAAVFLTLFLCVAVFISTYTIMIVQMNAAVNEQKTASAKFSKLDALLAYIQSNYVRDYDESDLWDGIYAGLFDAIGDPYTDYMTAEEYSAYTTDRSGSYVGIGIHVVYDPDAQGIHIYRVNSTSPAADAGLQAGDIITAVEDLAVTAETYAEAVSAVAGEAGTFVHLTILRGEETFEKQVARAEVKSENVLYEKLEGGIAYITILSFSESSVYDQFSAALEQAKTDGCSSYLFDVRNNPGGNLDVICQVLDLLLPEGIIVNIVAKDGSTTTRESDAEHFLDAPMVVLCNASTASAAELFTADLRDYQLAKIVGETTYGKGTMQTISPLGDGSAVKLTTRYYNPASNNSYDGVGIQPDVEVALTAEQASRFYLLSHEEDPQLQAAISLLLDDQN